MEKRMDFISGTLLFLSAVLASVKNVLIKTFTGYKIKNREFFGLQASIFGSGCIVLLFVNIFDFNGISGTTVLCAFLYGTFLVCAQWLYTIALTRGKTALCATVYSFGFVIPTLSGTMFWDETISVCGIIGIITVAPALVISGINPNDKTQSSKSNSYIIPLMLAMLSSGGLGVVQKVHQSSEYSNQRSTLILLAFAFAFLMSAMLFLTLKRGKKQLNAKRVGVAATVGAIFSCCNMLNTILAGWLDSAVFFPAINIGSILTSLVLGAIVYKEGLTKKDTVVLCLGVLAIVLVNL